MFGLFKPKLHDPEAVARAVLRSARDPDISLRFGRNLHLTTNRFPSLFYLAWSFLRIAGHEGGARARMTVASWQPTSMLLQLLLPALKMMQSSYECLIMWYRRRRFPNSISNY